MFRTNSEPWKSTEPGRVKDAGAAEHVLELYSYLTMSKRLRRDEKIILLIGTLRHTAF